MKNIIAILFVFLCIAHMQGQQKMSVTLNESIRIAQELSPASKIAGLTYQATAHEYKAYRASLRPGISISSDFPGLRRSYSNVQQDDGSPKFIYQSQTYSDISLNIDQTIPLTGSRVSVFSSISNFSILDDRGITNWRSNPFGIRLIQPLFRLNDVKWNLMEENLRYDLSKVEYYQELEDLATNITLLYFNALIARKDIIRAENNVANNDTIYTLSTGRFTVGSIAENELLESELNLMNARAALSRAQNEYGRAISQLRTALGISPDIEIEVNVPQDLPEITVDPEYAVEQAMKYSLQVKNYRLDQLQAERGLKSAKANNRLSADIIATFGLNQTGSTFNESFTNPIDQEFFSVGLNFPIFQWGAGKEQVMAATTRQKQLQMLIEQESKEFEVDIYYQVKNLSQLRTQLEISAKSDTVANRRYEITKNRYLIGKISIQELFIAQREKDQAQINYITNLQSFWLAFARLRAATLFDFIEMQPVGEIRTLP